jgi:methionyl-tRNA formyltransferase
MKPEKRKGKVVLVSGRPWSKGMAESLEARSAYGFELISDPLQLTVERLSSIAPEFVFFPHWSYRIEKAVYKQFECVIFHMTDLPFGRGGSPLQNLIARGIEETKISALRCVEELDAGPIYLKKPLSLQGSAEEIYLRAARIIEEMIVEILSTRPKPKPQVGKATVFKRKRPEESNLVAAKSLEQVFDMIRMLDAEGYPKAFLELGPIRFEFSRASRKTAEVTADVRIRLANSSKNGDKER